MFYFGYFRHAWLCTPTMIVSTCQKETSSFISFLRYYIFKEYCNLIGQQYFGPLLENQNFARYGIGGEISIAILVISFHFRLLPAKTNDIFFQKIPKTLFWDHFGQIWAKKNFFYHSNIKTFMQNIKRMFSVSQDIE